MSDGLASQLVVAAGAYLAVGLLFAVRFSVRWAGRLAPAAKAGTLGFRVLIVPGAVLLWPLLAAQL